MHVISVNLLPLLQEPYTTIGIHYQSTTSIQSLLLTKILFTVIKNSDYIYIRSYVAGINNSAQFWAKFLSYAYNNFMSWYIHITHICRYMHSELY